MGYYTDYTLTVHEGIADLNAVKKALDDITEYSYKEFFIVNDETYISSAESIKWYDHDEECAKMSKQFPGVVFKLHGEGEDTSDLWDAYYKNGLCQICRTIITYPDFDPAKLKSVDQAQREDAGRL